MKKPSGYYLLFEALNDAAGVKTQQLNIGKEDATGDSSVSGSTGGEEVSRTLNRNGKNLLDIMTTINAINVLNLDKTSMVLNQYLLTEYVLLSPLRSFIRPRKLVVGSETGVKQRDLLEGYADFCADAPVEGEVLSPTEFEVAQLNLLRAINPRCTQLKDVSSISRDVVVATEETILQYPISSDDDMYAVTRSDSVKLFPIRVKFYNDEDYIVKYTDKYLQDEYLRIWQQLVSVANQRDM